MQKTVRLENLGCANCAAKMERKIKKLPHVKNASINFLTCKLQLEVDDLWNDESFQEIQSIVSSIEPYCKVRF